MAAAARRPLQAGPGARARLEPRISSAMGTEGVWAQPGRSSEPRGGDEQGLEEGGS